jgi:hypothetical protein
MRLNCLSCNPCIETSIPQLHEAFGYAIRAKNAWNRFPWRAGSGWMSRKRSSFALARTTPDVGSTSVASIRDVQYNRTGRLATRRISKPWGVTSTCVMPVLSDLPP